jgi:hypothetical protein
MQGAEFDEGAGVRSISGTLKALIREYANDE